MTGRAIGAQTILYKFDDFASFDAVVRLPRTPVTSVSFVKYLDVDGVLQTISSDDYELDAETGSVAPVDEWPTALGTEGSVQIQFVAGYTPTNCPASILDYIKSFVGTLDANREAHSDKPVVAHQFTPRLLDRYTDWAI